MVISPKRGRRRTMSSANRYFITLFWIGFTKSYFGLEVLGLEWKQRECSLLKIDWEFGDRAYITYLFIFSKQVNAEPPKEDK
jgi:hypothetical protein